MKQILLVFFGVSCGLAAVAQEIIPDQNPNFASSRDKYIAIADSINLNQSTTQQQTYKAIDYLADKAEARAARKESRKQYRSDRGYYPSYYGYPANYYGHFSSYYPSYGIYSGIGYQFRRSYNHNYRNGSRYGNHHNFWSPRQGRQLLFGSPYNNFR